MLRITSPDPNSGAVALLRGSLPSSEQARYVPYLHTAGALLQSCFENVEHIVTEHGGRIVYGWAAWQHENIFIEAEHHSVWEKPTGEWVCITPQDAPQRQICFIPDEAAVFEISKRLQTDNVRVGLIQDEALKEFFHAASELTRLRNKAPDMGSGKVTLTGSDAVRYIALEQQKTFALMAVIQAHRPDLLPPPPMPYTNTSSLKVGRNEPCSCGSGKKYKKCHGV